MKIVEVTRLCEQYGENTTLGELRKKIQGKKIHKCPKCGGVGIICVKKDIAEAWECSSRWKYYDVKCDLCDGEGYTEHEYKPKMVQDGWEEVK